MDSDFATTVEALWVPFAGTLNTSEKALVMLKVLHAREDNPDGPAALPSKERRVPPKPPVARPPATSPPATHATPVSAPEVEVDGAELDETFVREILRFIDQHPEMVARELYRAIAPEDRSKRDKAKEVILAAREAGFVEVSGGNRTLTTYRLTAAGRARAAL